METLLNKRRPTAVTFTTDEVIVTLSDGSKISNPLDWHWWLQSATDEQRANAILGRSSILFPELDEGLDIEGMLRGIKSKQPRTIST